MPVPAMVTVKPDTVQTPGVVEVKVTGSPEDDIALTVNGATPKATSASGPNAIMFISETVQLEPAQLTETVWPAAIAVPDSVALFGLTKIPLARFRRSSFRLSAQSSYRGCQPSSQPAHWTH